VTRGRRAAPAFRSGSQLHRAGGAQGARRCQTGIDRKTVIDAVAKLGIDASKADPLNS
jgi:hypothetical protein